MRIQALGLLLALGMSGLVWASPAEGTGAAHYQVTPLPLEDNTAIMVDKLATELAASPAHRLRLISSAASAAAVMNMDPEATSFEDATRLVDTMAENFQCAVLLGVGNSTRYADLVASMDAVYAVVNQGIGADDIAVVLPAKLMELKAAGLLDLSSVDRRVKRGAQHNCSELKA